jgi:hypothetical protein
MSNFPQTKDEAIRCLSAELAAYTQDTRLFSLKISSEENLLLENFHGKESISDGGFCFEVTVLSDNAHLQEAEMLHKAVLIRLRTVEGTPESDRLFHGLVTAATFQGANGGFARYALRIEPWLSDLKHCVDSYLEFFRLCGKGALKILAIIPFARRKIVAIRPNEFPDHARKIICRDKRIGAKGFGGKFQNVHLSCAQLFNVVLEGYSQVKIAIVNRPQDEKEIPLDLTRASGLLYMTETRLAFLISASS